LLDPSGRFFQGPSLWQHKLDEALHRVMQSTCTGIGKVIEYVIKPSVLKKVMWYFFYMVLEPAATIGVRMSRQLLLLGSEHLH